MPRPIRIPILGQDKYSTVLGKAARDIGAFSQKIGNIGRSLTAMITLPALGAGAAASALSMKLNEGMANVATLIPGNIGRIQELKKSVQDLSIATGKSTGDLSEGLYQTISAFQDSAETAKLLEINARAAAAGLSTTTEAINLTSAVSKAFGDTTARSVQKIADLGLLTVRLGQTTFPELAGSIGRVTPLAKELGVSAEEMFAAYAAGTGPLGSASDVSTQLASVMTALMKPTGKLASLYDYLGVKSGKAMVAGLGFQGALARIAQEAKKADVPLAELLGRKEAMLITLGLAGEQADDYAQKLGAMRRPAGSLQQAFAELQGGINKVGFSFKQFQRYAVVVAQEIGDLMGPAIVEVAGHLTSLLGWIRQLSPATKKMGLVMVGLAAAVGPVLLVVSGVAAAIAALATPIGATVAAVTAGVIAIGALATLVITKWEPIKAFFANVWDFATKLFNSRIGQLILLTNPLTVLPTLMIKHWSKFVEFFKAAWGWIKQIGEDIGELFAGIAEKMKPFTEIIGQVAGAGGGLLGKAGRWLLGNDEGTAFFGGGSGMAPPIGAAALAQSYYETRHYEQRREEQHVRVSFDGMPKGARVNQESGRPLDMDLGYAFGW